MKALVIAEHSEAARELAAGARTLADEVALVVFGEAPENVADAAYIVEVPEGAVARRCLPHHSVHLRQGAARCVAG